MISTASNNHHSRLIHLFSWSGLIDSKLLMKDVFQVPNLKTGKMEPMITALTDEEEEQFKNMLTRLNTVFQVKITNDNDCIHLGWKLGMNLAGHCIHRRQLLKARESPFLVSSYALIGVRNLYLGAAPATLIKF